MTADYKKTDKHLYLPGVKPAIVDVPEKLRTVIRYPISK